jgi:hypothetical protein
MNQDSASLAEHMTRLRREIEQARFGGDDPAVEVAPSDPVFDIVAKTLVAERINAPLRLGGTLLPLQEDVAEALFHRGVSALRYWGFAAALSAFEEAAAKTTMSVLQQRLTLYRAATALVRRVVQTDPDRPLRPAAEERATTLVDSLDALSPAERAHYAAELQRLIALRRAVLHDAYLQTVHGLLRARLAIGSGDETVGLGWLLRVAARESAHVQDNAYLADLLTRARAYLQQLLDEQPRETPSSTADDDELRASELLAALASQLDRALGYDTQGAAAQFGFAPYHEP